MENDSCVKIKMNLKIIMASKNHAQASIYIEKCRRDMYTCKFPMLCFRDFIRNVVAASACSLLSAQWRERQCTYAVCDQVDRSTEAGDVSMMSSFD